MSRQVKVSVVIPVYNSEKYLRQCLNSVLSQSLREIEIICIDDGSDDNSGTILKEYCQKDSRMQVFHQQNKYAGCARNLGLENALGKYVVFWDSDDYFAEKALEKLYNKCEEDQADIGICGAERVDEETGINYPAIQYLVRRRLPIRRPFNREDMGRDLFNFCSNVPWNKMFLRSFVSEHNLRFQPLRQANDIYFVMLALFYAERITVVEDDLIFYRFYNSFSLSGRTCETRFCTAEAFKAVLSKLEKENDFTEDIRKSFVAKTVGPLFMILRSQKSYLAYEELYGYYRDIAFPELGLFDQDQQCFNNPMDYIMVRKLFELVPQDFMLYLIQSNERDLNMTKGKLSKCRKQKEKLKKEKEGLKKEKEMLIVQIGQLKNSLSYKTGRAITFLPRMIKRLLSR